MGQDLLPLTFERRTPHLAAFLRRGGLSANHLAWTRRRNYSIPCARVLKLVLRATHAS